MKLDNRPKRLLVKGAGEEHAQAVREWYNVSLCLLSLFLVPNECDSRQPKSTRWRRSRVGISWCRSGQDLLLNR